MTERRWTSNGRAVRTLRRAVLGTDRDPGLPEERCEMCARPVPGDHSHVVDLDSRELLCACRPCALLFMPEGAAAGRYQTVPERYLSFDGFTLDQARWDALSIPVGMAFFFRNSRLDRTAAFYPSPAGATESELPIEAWDDILDANPELRQAVPNVEAILVAGPDAERLTPPGAGDDGRFECFLVPVDACYELVGHLRVSWRGFDGGQEVRERLAAFFADLRRRCRPARGPRPTADAWAAVGASGAADAWGGTDAAGPVPRPRGSP
ncbi:DUF5947 family protein [Nocardiopsis oceani]